MSKINCIYDATHEEGDREAPFQCDECLFLKGKVTPLCEECKNLYPTKGGMIDLCHDCLLNKQEREFIHG